MELEKNFLDERLKSIYPSHGWAYNSQKVKLLWIPIKRLLRNYLVIRNEKCPCSPLPPKHCQITISIEAFCRCLYKLSIVLRELYKFSRLVRESRIDLNNIEFLRLSHDIHTMVPLYIDLFFIYLRRIADMLVRSCRPLLFEKWQAAPQEYKKLIILEKFDHLNPICDLDILVKTLRENSNWFTSLRNRSDIIREKGIRDIMEHKSHYLGVGMQASGEEKPYLSIQMIAEGANISDFLCIEDMIPKLMEDFCLLLTGIHSAIKYGEGYDWYDNLCCSTGTDEDIVGFWPELKG